MQAAVIEGDTFFCLEAGGMLKPLVPEHMRRALFNKFHNLAHAGIIATRRMISTRFAWPGLATDMATWVKECRHCHLSKPGTLDWSTHPWPFLYPRFTPWHPKPRAALARFDTALNHPQHSAQLC